MVVADTSIEALKQKVNEGSDLTDRERCRWIIYSHGPLTMQEMETSMGKNKHTFTGRIKELKDSNVVEKVGTKDGHQLLDLVEQSDVKLVDENGDEWVSASENVEVDEDVDGLFEEDKQSEELEPGDVIYG